MNPRKLFSIIASLLLALPSWAAQITGVISAPSTSGGVIANGQLQFTLDRPNVVAGSFLAAALTVPVTCEAFIHWATTASMCEGEILLPSRRVIGTCCAARRTETVANARTTAKRKNRTTRSTSTTLDG